MTSTLASSHFGSERRAVRTHLCCLTGLLLAVALSACCSETDYDFAIEREEGSERSCSALCRNYLDAATLEDVTFELHGCKYEEGEDGRDLAVCHVTEVNCVNNNHF